MIKHVIMEYVSVMDAGQTMIAVNFKDVIKVIVLQPIFAYLNADMMKLASMEYANLRTRNATPTMIVQQDGNVILVSVFNQHMSA